jgi:glycosyltransferase involved in cell wall biosynthesis
VFHENLSYIKHICPKAPLIFDTVDLNFLREQRDFEQMVQRLKGSTLDPQAKAAALKKVIADRIAQSAHTPELSLMQVADLTLVVSELEKNVVETMSPELKVRVVSNIYNPPDKLEDSDPKTRHGALFVGSMCYPPNLQAVQFIVQEILAERKFPEGFKMHIVLSKSKECKEYARAAIKVAHKHPLVIMHRDISSLDMRRLHKQVMVVIAPAQFGVGVKGKVNYALLHGVPVISTSIGSEGLHLQDGKSFVLANSGAEFESAIISLHDNVTLWHSVRNGGLEVMHQWFSREVATTSLLKTIEDLKVPNSNQWTCPYYKTDGCFSTIKSSTRIMLYDDVMNKGTTLVSGEKQKPNAAANIRSSIGNILDRAFGR